MNGDLKRFKAIGDRIHRRDWLKRFTGWFLLWVFGVMFGYAWSAITYGNFLIK